MYVSDAPFICPSRISFCLDPGIVLFLVAILIVILGHTVSLQIPILVLVLLHIPLSLLRILLSV